MYKLSIPLMNDTVNEQTRAIYAAQFQEAGADRVFLSLGRILDRRVADETMVSLGDNIAFFKNAGFEVGVWMNAFGHGVGEGGADGFLHMVDHKGNTQHGVCCPFDEHFVEEYAYLAKVVAEQKPDVIMVDDDFRMSLRGPMFGCFCEQHMVRFQEICGETFDRAFFVEQVFSGKTNKYRAAYLQAQSEAMWQAARGLREAVDGVDRRIPIILCCTVDGFDCDGIDAAELAHYWAGEGQPELRLAGAPYWARVNTTSLPGVIETARMLSSMLQNSGVQLMSECDAYPRPRYNIPASYLELLDAALRADGSYDGILKYMVEYFSGPTYETGYLRLHNYDKPALEAVGHFADGDTCGVQVIAKMRPFAKADFSLMPPDVNSPWAFAGTMLARCSVPTTYVGTSPVKAVFGENARDFIPKADDCLIIDGAAALILHEQGVDVGLRKVNAWLEVAPEAEYLADGEKVNLQPILCSTDCHLLCGEYDDAAVVLSRFAVKGKDMTSIGVPMNDSNKIVAAYRYQNAAGQKFLVFPFSVEDSKSLLYKHYGRQRILLETIEQFFGYSLPVKSETHPDLYLLAKKTENGLSVIACNCFDDPIIAPVFTLDDAYQKVDFVNTDGTLDGHTVCLNNPIPAFSFVAFTAQKA